VIDRAVAEEPTVITRHGRKEAVLVSFDEWERVSKVPSFADLLLSFPARRATFPSGRASSPVPCATASSENMYLVDTNIDSADAPTKQRVGVEAFARGSLKERLR
jgi:hypothetical protein